jgi:hypothetical protein
MSVGEQFRQHFYEVNMRWLKRLLQTKEEKERELRTEFRILKIRLRVFKQALEDATAANDSQAEKSCRKEKEKTERKIADFVRKNPEFETK